MRSGLELFMVGLPDKTPCVHKAHDSVEAAGTKPGVPTIVAGLFHAYNVYVRPCSLKEVSTR